MDACTDPCFLALTRMDCAEKCESGGLSLASGQQGLAAPTTCQEVDASKGKPGLCGL